MEESVAVAEDTKDDAAITTSDQQSQKMEKSPQKSHRKRKRKYLNAVRELMEFYFGDANLSKDRFLMKLISEDQFVPLEVFLTFNKMKKLTTCISDIAKSLSNSQLLELDSDQQKVRRKTELPTERNVDHKTLYVESLPPTADHEWMKTMFSRFGLITYVSLPRYRQSKKIKEFGFIEFDQESSVEKAVKAFREFNGVLSMETSKPADLISVKSFIREQNNEEEPVEAKKRRHTSESSESQPDSKRTKVDTADKEATSTAAATDDQTETDNEENRRKRRRKKKKRKRNSEPGVNPDADFIEIRILPKKDWKRLRNKYLNLQREKTAEFKRLAWKSSQNEEGQTKKIIEKPAKRLKKINMNFYGAGNENDENQVAKFNDRSTNSPKINPAEEKAPLFSYEPGLIVEVGFLEPCVTLREFKADMRQYDTVKYVDIKEGAMQAFLRLDTDQAALDFVKQVSCAEYNCKVLSGDAESEYWEKIKLDREAKLNKKVKIPKKRGREKMKKLISKHLRFEDDDAE